MGWRGVGWGFGGSKGVGGGGGNKKEMKRDNV